MELSCFKAYDVRGILGETLDNAVAERIGRAFADQFGPGEVVVGFDARETSPTLAAALSKGLMEQGCDVVSLGLCGTEEVYFATGHLKAAGGVMVTASHNPIEYNGMKFVGPGSRPVDPKSELASLKATAEADTYDTYCESGSERGADLRHAYATHVAKQCEPSAIGPMRVVANAGNGTAGAAFDAILEELTARGAQLDVVRQHHAPDSTFPNGIPNPLVAENQSQTADRVVAEKADIGLAWDGDFDRCFFFDETGEIVPGEMVVAVLAEAALKREPGAPIVHDPRVTGAIRATVEKAGGVPTSTPTGHAFLKAKMRETNAPYGGEMSAHHYFSDFFFCDSGMIPWVQFLEILSVRGVKASELVADLKARFPSSGEINFRVADPKATMASIEDRLAKDAEEVDRQDGMSLDFGTWRMNLRASNTEPLLRLNVETKGDPALLEAKVAELRSLIETNG